MRVLSRPARAEMCQTMVHIPIKYSTLEHHVPLLRPVCSLVVISNFVSRPQNQPR